MNPIALNAHLSRRQALETETSSPLAGERDRNLAALAEPELGCGTTDEEVRRLRLALSQLLARETGQDIEVFRNPVVENQRLCDIADNIWHGRPWAASHPH